MARTVVIDERIESYRSFFDHEWSKQIFAIVKSTPLEVPTFDLCVAWREAANTHTMPWLLVTFLGKFAEGFSNARDPYGKQLCSVLVKRLVSQMNGSLRLMQKKELQKAVEAIDAEMRDVLEETPFQFDVNGAWREFFGISEFQFSLSGSQRLCYGAIYFAYEDFLVQCYRIVGKIPHYRMGREFSKDFAAAFGSDILDQCWSDSVVNIARLARHALVHNGGRITRDLEKQRHPFRVEDGQIQIMAPETASLYHALKGRASRLAGAAATLM